MKRLYKKALIDLKADDMRLSKEPLEPAGDKSDIEPLVDKGPTFEQPPVTHTDVDNEFAVEDTGMGIEMKGVNEGLLNDLASLQVLYQQTKLFHWIFNGENYIATHRFLDEVAEAVEGQVDLLAERLMFLGCDPVADPTMITTLSYVQFVQMNRNFKFTSLLQVLDNSFTQIINSMKDNSIRAGEGKDLGTANLLDDCIYELETWQHHIRSFR